jgi:Fe-S-cluster containining protein
MMRISIIRFSQATRRNDRRQARQVYLAMSAIAEGDGKGRCPALADMQCSTYDKRLLKCRTVPLHYSRAPSRLVAYLERFTGSVGCN